jgi:hypothetical protein
MASKRVLYIAGIIIIFTGLTLGLKYIENKKSGDSVTVYKNIIQKQNKTEKLNANNIVILGTNSNGLFVSYNGGRNFNQINSKYFINNGKYVSIKQVLPLSKKEYIFVTDKNGLVYTDDAGISFRTLNKGLPKKPLFINGSISNNIYRDINAVTQDTNNPDNLVLTTKYGIYMSKNRGSSWFHYSKPPRSYNNLTAVAFSTKHGFHLYIGTAYNGLFLQEEINGNWIRLNRGLKMTGSIVEEIGSLLIDPKNPMRVYCGHNFANSLYKLNPANVKFKKNAQGKVIDYSVKNCTWDKVRIPFDKKRGTIEVLNDIKDLQVLYTNKTRKLVILTNRGIRYKDNVTKKWNELRINDFLSTFKQTNDINTLTVFSKGKLDYSFSNIGLLKSRWKFAKKSRYYDKAKNRRGFYIQTHLAFQKKRLGRLIKYLKKLNYNMVTIDLKDDFGMVNYHSNLDIVKKIGSDKGTKINLKRFVKKMHENGIYVVARLVVFKDPVLFKYNNGKYAAFDKKNKKAWRAEFYRGKRVLRNKERWTDPYCSFVWKYNVAIAKEMESMGVDEIQFDYIRFPTDGDNKDDIKFRYRKQGQEQKDAIESFLYLARNRLNIPISVDIYGANGWYHMGDRIGQDVEMLAKYVDAICPMFYPSHFENSFLNFKPYRERPYRIYYYGTRRSLLMARYAVEIRSWLQAFRLRSNRYDRKYYGSKYVAYSILGVRHAKKGSGYTYWHSGSKYRIVPKAHEKLPKLVAGIYNTGKNSKIKQKKTKKDLLSYNEK